MLTFRLIIILLLSCIAFPIEALARCDLSSHLSFYYHAINDPGNRGADLTLNISSQKAKYKTMWGERKESGKTNEEPRLPTALANYLRDGASKQMYIGFLFTRKSSSQASLLIKNNPPDNSISISEKGVIALFRERDVRLCNENPEIIYLIPSDAEEVNNIIEDQIIRLPVHFWDELITDIVRHNANEVISGNTVEELLDTERVEVPFEVRYQMLKSFFNVKVYFNIDKPEETAHSGDQNFPKFKTVLPEYKTHVANAFYGAQHPPLRDFNSFQDKIADLNHYINPFLMKLHQNQVIPRIEAQSAMNKISNLLTEVKPYEILAQEYLDKLKKESEQTRDMRITTKYFELYRLTGNTVGAINTLAESYIKFNDFLENTPSPQTGEMFDASKIEAVKHQVGEQCTLTTHKFSFNNLPYSGFGTSANFDGDLYVQYRKYKHPVDKITLYRPVTYAVIDTSKLKGIIESKIKSYIPQSTCSQRYKFNTAKDLSFDISTGPLIARGGVLYEHWYCGTYAWFCVDHFKFRKCRKEIKTKTYSSKQSFEVPTYAGIQRNNLVLTSYLPQEGESVYRTDLSRALEENNHNVFNDLLSLNWENASFKFSKNSSLLLVLKGKGRPMRASSACAMHETITKHK